MTEHLKSLLDRVEKAGGEKPFLYAALVKKPHPTGYFEGVRGGLQWGRSVDEVRGRLTAAYIDEGYSVEICDVSPMSAGAMERIASLIQENSNG